MNLMKYSVIASFAIIGLFVTESEAIAPSRSGSSSRSSSHGSPFSPSKQRRPSGSDPNDPRYRKSNSIDYPSDDDKKKKKKKNFF